MNTFRRLTALILAMALCLSLLTGCGSTNPPASTPADASAAGSASAVEEDADISADTSLSEEDEVPAEIDYMAEFPFYGLWHWDNYDASIMLNAYHYYYYIDAEGSSDDSPVCEWKYLEDQKLIVLNNEFGGEDTTLTMNENGCLVDASGDTLSPVPVPVDSEAAAYVGIWKWDDYNASILISDNYTYQFLNVDGINDTGIIYTWKYLDDQKLMVLNNEFGGEDTTLTMNEDGSLVDGGGDVLHLISLSSEASAFVGQWQLDGTTLNIYDNGTYEFAGGDGTLYPWEYVEDRGAAVLHDREDGEYNAFTMNEDGTAADVSGAVWHMVS